MDLFRRYGISLSPSLGRGGVRLSITRRFVYLDRRGKREIADIMYYNEQENMDTLEISE